MYKRCPHCNAVNDYQSVYCGRCKMKIEKGIAKPLALALSGLIFYIPANIFPILQMNKFFEVSTNTIIGGIFELWASGDYPVAIIVFLASVLIPILKFVIIFYLVYCIKFKKCAYLKIKRKLYKFISVTGHWSLLDVFVVVILTGLISSENIYVLPKDGAFYFLIMVIFTILSVKSLNIDNLGDVCGKTSNQ